jgi:hypothetical protein
MSVDDFFDSIDPDPRARLRRRAWRAELLADVEEKTEEVARRFEGREYEGAGPQVVQARETAERLKELADRHTGADLTDPAAMADLSAALATATTLVRALEDRGMPGEDPAEATAH